MVYRPVACSSTSKPCRCTLKLPPTRPVFPVQWVIRPISDRNDAKLGNLHDYRGFAGRMASGTFRVGDDVLVYPSEMKTKITGIHTFEGPQQEAIPQRYSITVADEIDTSRGGMIVKPMSPCRPRRSSTPSAGSPTKILKPRGRFHLRHTTNDVRAVVTEVHYKVNISTLEKSAENKEFALNDIGASAPLRRADLLRLLHPKPHHRQLRAR